jgi:hypothetical protein
MLKSVIKREGAKVEKALARGAMGGARRFAALLADVYDNEGITYQGILKNSVKAVKRGNSAAVVVDAPHAGIIELGARPHPVSREGVEAIARWVTKKLQAVAGPTKKVYDHLAGKYKISAPKDRRTYVKVAKAGPVREQFVGPTKQGVKLTKPGSYNAGYTAEALAVAYAIAANIKKYGQKPRYVVRRHLQYASDFYAQEVERVLRSAA